MFLDYYQLKEQPFGVTPDPHYLYLGESHREALASLFYGLTTDRGLLALVAAPGMGKTTILFRLLEHLRQSARTVFLFQTQCDSHGLLRYVLQDLGIDTRGQDFVTMHGRLNELLLSDAKNGRRFVLVIDEAQNLDDSVLETARLLSDFETASKKLLQIVFVGQLQLAEKLHRPGLLQLRQRISILARLKPLSVPEVTNYINHRLKVAGHNGGDLFRPQAVERIAVSSQGIPRNINNLCFTALSLGCALDRKQIDVDLILEAEGDLDLSVLADQRRNELPPIVPPVVVEPRAAVADVTVSGRTSRRNSISHRPILDVTEKANIIGRRTAVACALGLLIFAGVLYRQDLQVAVVRMRGRLAQAATKLTSHSSAVKAQPVALPVSPQQIQKKLAPVANDSVESKAKGVPVVASLTEVSMTTAMEPQGQVSAAPNVGYWSQFNDGTSAVVVQPQDDLRQICLRHLGRYDAELAREINALNPEISDPDRITVGQRIVLPAPSSVKTKASKSSPVSRP